MPCKASRRRRGRRRACPSRFRSTFAESGRCNSAAGAVLASGDGLLASGADEPAVLGKCRGIKLLFQLADFGFQKTDASGKLFHLVIDDFLELGEFGPGFGQFVLGAFHFDVFGFLHAHDREGFVFELVVRLPNVLDFFFDGPELFVRLGHVELHLKVVHTLLAGLEQELALVGGLSQLLNGVMGGNEDGFLLGDLVLGALTCSGPCLSWSRTSANSSRSVCSSRRVSCRVAMPNLVQCLSSSVG